MIDGECQTFISDCQVRAATDLLSHSWDPIVMAALRAGPTRRSVLLRTMTGLSDKVLTECLRRLVARRLVARTPASTGAVYELTALGSSFASGPLVQLAEWAADHAGELSAS